MDTGLQCQDGAEHRAAVVELLESISEGQLSDTEAHHKVVSLLESCKTTLEEPGSHAATVLSTMEELVGSIPTTSTGMLCTLLAAIEHCLSVCSLMEASSDLSPLLSALFKTTYSQLKTTVGLIDTLTTESSSLGDHVVTALIRVAEVAVRFDPSVLALCWRVLGKCLSKVTMPQPVIRALCSTLEIKFRECCEFEGRLFKLVSFLAGLLCRAIQESELRELAGIVLPCLLSVLNKVYCTPYQEQAMLLKDTVLSVMVHSRRFLELLLTTPLIEEHSLGRLICVCGLIPLLPKLEDRLLEFCVDKTSSSVQASHSCILTDTLFHCLKCSYVPLQLPVRVHGVMSQGRPARMISLQEYVTIHMCALCSVVPLTYLNTIEKLLFKGVLSPVLHISIICTDAWMFHARRCPVSTLNNYCQLLCSLLHEVNSPLLSSLLYRVLLLLPPSSQPLSPSVLTPLLLSSKQLPHSIQPARQLLQHSLHTMDLPSIALIVSFNEQSNKVAVMEHIVTRLPHTRLTDWPPLIKLLCKLPLTQAHFDKVIAVSMNCWDETTMTTLCSVLQQFAPEFAHCTQSLAVCFEHLISSHSWLVHHLSLDAFRALAKVHGNTVFVESCVPPGYTEALVQFLHQRPCGDWSNNHLELALKQQSTGI